MAQSSIKKVCDAENAADIAEKEAKHKSTVIIENAKKEAEKIINDAVENAQQSAQALKESALKRAGEASSVCAHEAADAVARIVQMADAKKEEAVQTVTKIVLGI